MKNTAKLLGVAILIMVISTLFTGCTAGPMIAPQYSNAYPPPDPKPGDKVVYVIDQNGNYVAFTIGPLYTCQIMADPKNSSEIPVTIFRNGVAVAQLMATWGGSDEGIYNYQQTWRNMANGTIPTHPITCMGHFGTFDGYKYPLVLQ